MAPTECMNIKYMMKMHGGKFGKEFAKKATIKDFFQCKLTLILVSLQPFRQANGTKIRSI